MAGLRDVVRALGGRPGVTAVMVVSGDGLTIDQAGSGLDADTVAALVPAIVSNAKRLGTSAGQGELAIGAFEFAGATAVIATLGADAILLVFCGQGADIGQLLFDLNAHRTALATLV
jgi:predicted regulator of Ras-like GTPase activity (Roadblock/LC7/MglB family)